MYHFGVSGIVIWLSHILMGIFFAYIGYLTLNKKQLPQIISLILIILGVLAFLYHLHLWVYKSHSHGSKSNMSGGKKIISTFKGKKYDLTDWNKLHPGGPVLDKANGKDLMDVWKKNGVGWHLSNNKVMKTLEKYLIK